ncbi:MAG: Crp/Fnr family transcriptional regulator [Acidobacteria bacterium]|nr:Crp/Fnr family transcriptional regulator [Acidobacteriota bacterium]
MNAIRQARVCPKGTVLFTEGEAPRGLVVLCSGRVKLTAASSGGRSLIVRVAEPGEVLGLSAVMTDSAYEVSAKTLELSQISFLPRDDFLRFLRSHAEVSLRVARHLGQELRRAYHQVTRIALAPTARAKLAGLLLDWAGCDAHPAAKAGRLQLHLTHEEIGELIGSSRETIARLLNDFRRKGLIRMKGTLITIPEPRKLDALL